MVQAWSPDGQLFLLANTTTIYFFCVDRQFAALPEISVYFNVTTIGEWDAEYHVVNLIRHLIIYVYQISMQ